MLIAVATLLAQVSVEGLRADETLTYLAPPRANSMVESNRVFHRNGRVLDAFTLRPISGAIVELWTEEITEVSDGLRRLGWTSTAATGQFTVQAIEGDLFPEKARISASGYATQTVPASELGFGQPKLLFPMGEAARIQFVDSQGKPIVGGSVTSTYSCAHDISALNVTANAQGEYVLDHLGPQDSIPTLRFRAPGYRAIKYLDAERAFMAQDRGTIAEWPVARLERPLLRVVDKDQRPFKQTLLHLRDGDGHHLVRTTKGGFLRVPSGYSSGLPSIHLLKNDRWIGWLPDWCAAFDQEWNVLQDAEGWQSRDDLATVRVHYDAALHTSDWPPQFASVHLDGWQDEQRAREEDDGYVELQVPEGWTSIGWGAPFGAHLPGSIPLEVEAGETYDVQAAVTLGIPLEIDLPEDVYVEWIEQGNSSTELNRNDNTVYLAAGQEAALCLRGHEGVEVIRIDPIHEATTFAPAQDVLDRITLPPTLPPKVSVRIQLQSVEAAAHARLSGSCLMTDESVQAKLSDDSSAFVFEVPAGSRVLYQVSKDNGLAHWDMIKVEGERAQHREWQTIHGAQIELELPDGYRLASEKQINLAGPIAPGPIDLFIDGPDSRIGLRLNLQAGEQRKLVLRVD